MNRSILIGGLAITLLAMPAFANDPVAETAEQPEKVEAISRADFVRQQYEMFNKADKNFDGQVTNDEITRLTHDKNKPRYVKAFKEIDTNSNGFLSYDEIEAKHVELTEQRMKRFSKTKENLLRTYDKDENGIITSQEIDAFTENRAQGFRDLTPRNAKSDMKGKDTDNSGSVSLDEYLANKGRTRDAIRLAALPNPDTRTLTRDPNGDKIIKRSENEAFVAAMFESLDKNKDDELSAAEQAENNFNRGESLSTRTLFITDGQTGVFRSK